MLLEVETEEEEKNEMCIRVLLKENRKKLLLLNYTVPAVFLLWLGVGLMLLVVETGERKEKKTCM